MPTFFVLLRENFLKVDGIVASKIDCEEDPTTTCTEGPLRASIMAARRLKEPMLGGCARIVLSVFVG